MGCPSSVGESEIHSFKDLFANSLGSFFNLTKYPELTLDAWAKKFGDIYSMWLGNQLFVIVSDPKIAKDLMVTNGAVFSSRKEMFIKSQTIFAGRGITATPYNDRWKKHRRLAVTWLSQKAVHGYTHVLDFEATEMVRCMYDASKIGPVNPQVHAGRCSLNNMLTVTFGARSESVNDPIVKEALRLSREFMNCTGPMSNLIDFVPLLQCFDIKLKRRAERLHKDLVKVYGGMIDEIRVKLSASEVVDDCLAKDLVNVQVQEELDELDMAILASAFVSQ